MLRTPASVQTHNKYRDILGAALDYAVRRGWLEANPIADVDRLSGKATRRRILRRDDFYNRDEVDRLLKHVAGAFEEAFLLCGAHAGFRLPGEALGLRWGAVDFHVGVIRPYDNWVQNAPEDTKTSEFAPIPMTPRLTRALAEVKQRDFTKGDGDFVFASDRGGSPVSGKGMRDALSARRCRPHVPGALGGGDPGQVAARGPAALRRDGRAALSWETGARHCDALRGEPDAGPQRGF